ncbi:unnamed protein product [Closterium sp. NIES-65]|nr:unnamed protein product [Closterium sp. NIES-65]
MGALQRRIPRVHVASLQLQGSPLSSGASLCSPRSASSSRAELALRHALMVPPKAAAAAAAAAAARLLVSSHSATGVATGPSTNRSSHSRWVQWGSKWRRSSWCRWGTTSTYEGLTDVNDDEFARSFTNIYTHRTPAGPPWYAGSLFLSHPRSLYRSLPLPLLTLCRTCTLRRTHKGHTCSPPCHITPLLSPNPSPLSLPQSRTSAGQPRLLRQRFSLSCTQPSPTGTRVGVPPQHGALASASAPRQCLTALTWLTCSYTDTTPLVPAYRHKKGRRVVLARTQLRQLDAAGAAQLQVIWGSHLLLCCPLPHRSHHHSLQLPPFPKALDTNAIPPYPSLLDSSSCHILVPTARGLCLTIPVPLPSPNSLSSPSSSSSPNVLQELEGWLGNSRARWKVVVGHHPVFSYGHHGDQQEMIDRVKPLLEVRCIDDPRLCACAYIDPPSHVYVLFFYSTCFPSAPPTTTHQRPVHYFTVGGGSKAWRSDAPSEAPGLRFYFPGPGFSALQVDRDRLSSPLLWRGRPANVLHHSGKNEGSHQVSQGCASTSQARASAHSKWTGTDFSVAFYGVGRPANVLHYFEEMSAPPGV